MKKYTGIIRRVNERNQLVLSQDIMKLMQWNDGTPLQIFVDPDTNALVIQKYNEEDTRQVIADELEALRRNQAELNENGIQRYKALLMRYIMEYALQ